MRESLVDRSTPGERGLERLLDAAMRRRIRDDSVTLADVLTLARQVHDYRDGTRDLRISTIGSECLMTMSGLSLSCLCPRVEMSLM